MTLPPAEPLNLRLERGIYWKYIQQKNAPDNLAIFASGIIGEMKI
jgi:hypothetical protein